MKRQKKRQNGDNSDRLSNLPDHLLLHIMEFMPIKHSIQTCVLSKRWKDLWKSLTMLILHHLRDKKCVSHILSGRDDSLPLHKLRYYHRISKNKKGKNLHLDLETKLLEVMKYGASHNMKHLTVRVDPGLIKDLELPPSIFHCHSLTTLKLDFRHPVSHDYIKILFPKSLNLPALKSMYLAFLTFTTSENGCAEPFSACNMLNNLFIFCCCLQDDAKALCISNSNVSLVVVGDTCDHTKGSYKKVVFCTPKLAFLSILGYPVFVAPSVCNLPFLEEGNIDHGYSDRPFKESLMIDWLHLLAGVKKMNISFRTFCELHTFQKKYPTNIIVPCFVRLKSLEVLWTSDSQIFDEIIIGKVKEMVTCLLQNSLRAKVDVILKAGSTPRKLEASVGARFNTVDG
ncbi:unnamed protein product [Trifolium pratense]|uniref:Uncharacterized protein n=1 Tax=Trifolium pratense TaxID=57577 RepID=A0ACB0JLR5_TRIPR|nr:unnamed protein product [Trifolium pratense]